MVFFNTEFPLWRSTDIQFLRWFQSSLKGKVGEHPGPGKELNETNTSLFPCFQPLWDSGHDRRRWRYPVMLPGEDGGPCHNAHHTVLYCHPRAAEGQASRRHQETALNRPLVKWPCGGHAHEGFWEAIAGRRTHMSPRGQRSVLVLRASLPRSFGTRPGLPRAGQPSPCPFLGHSVGSGSGGLGQAAGHVLSRCYLAPRARNLSWLNRSESQWISGLQFPWSQPGWLFFFFS